MSEDALTALGPVATVTYRGRQLAVTVDRATRNAAYDGVQGRMNLGELRFAKHRLGLTDEECIDAALAPVGPIIVGEAPGENTSRWFPMFPYPATSAGGRLLKFSAMSAADYLRTFHRVNLMADFSKKWNEEQAITNAVRLRLTYRGHPMILLGMRVMEAFGLLQRLTLEGRFGVWDRGEHGWLVGLPHPSGRSHAYNDPETRHLALRTLWKAVRLWHSPTRAGGTGPEVCEGCGKFASLHPQIGPDPHYRLMCPGDPEVYRPSC